MMTINVAFKFVKIVVIKEARNRKGVPQVGRTRKETVEIEVAVASSKFNNKTVRASGQYSCTLKSMQLGKKADPSKS